MKASYEYFKPLVQAYKDRLWGNGEPIPTTPHYLAMDILANEKNLYLRRVRVAVPHYRTGGQLIQEAKVQAVILFDGKNYILCDLLGNETASTIVRAFAKAHDLELEKAGKWKAPTYWEDSPPNPYQSDSPSQTRLEILANSARSYLQSLALSSEQKTLNPSRASRRI